MLDVSDITFQRGEDGQLISQEVELETLPDKPTVKVRPLTRGKLQEIYSMATSNSAEEKIKADSEVIKQGLVEPKLTEESIRDLKPSFAQAISMAILSISLGTSQEDVAKQTEDLLKSQEDSLKKN